MARSSTRWMATAWQRPGPCSPSVSREAVRQSLNTGEQFWDLVVPVEFHNDVDLIARLRRDTMSHWPAVLDESVVLYPGIGTMLARLRSAGVRLGICTASRGESFRPLERAGLMDCFEEIVTARDVTSRKPHPEGLLLCMARMGIRPEETVYVGDSVADVQASHAAGMYAIGVLTGAADSSLLSGAGAHRILADLQGLPDLLLT
jgi:HAD superfamily hydrolase (TIGR01509 family)